jgi:hypothetical protein
MAVKIQSVLCSNRRREFRVKKRRGVVTYRLRSEAEATIHLDSRYRTDLLLQRLTVEAGRRVERGRPGSGELARRLGTSTSQIRRLLDPTNYRKSMERMLELLGALGWEVDFVVRERSV